MSREFYAMKTISTARFLEPPMSDEDIIKYLARHFSEDIRDVIAIHGITQVDSLLKYLRRMDDVKPRRRKFEKATNVTRYHNLQLRRDGGSAGLQHQGPENRYHNLQLRRDGGSTGLQHQGPENRYREFQVRRDQRNTGPGYRRHDFTDRNNREGDVMRHRGRMVGRTPPDNNTRPTRTETRGSRNQDEIRTNNHQIIGDQEAEKRRKNDNQENLNEITVATIETPPRRQDF